MTSSGVLQRLELALAALGLTAASLALLIAMDALQFHVALLWNGFGELTLPHLQWHGVLLLALGGADSVIITRAVWSLARRVRKQRRFLRALPIRSEMEIDGHLVRVFPGRALQAFCAGLLRPAVYVSSGTLRQVNGPELRAILAHEQHHRLRRDPLRMLLAQVVSDAFRPLPSLVMLADRQAALADLAADAAAVRALGDVRPLASALMRFDQRAGNRVAPERVDHLAGQAPRESISAPLLVSAWLAVGSIAAVALPMLLFGWHPDPAVPLALEVGALTAACVPAYLAARQADACIRPTA